MEAHPEKLFVMEPSPKRINWEKFQIGIFIPIGALTEIVLRS